MTVTRWLPVVVALALTAPGEAVARDFSVSSFDGTRIEAHFFPAEDLASGNRAPTVLYGPGWGNGGSTDQNRPAHETDGTIGVGPLRRAGYNVLTWDPRGFGGSGGEAKWDSPDYEARDVQALLDKLAGFSEARLDAADDPRVGMAGASYGGGVQWATTAIDDRVDVITPVVAWHSLVTSFYRGGIFKAGWGGALCGTGAAQGISTGLVNPAGAAAGSMDPHMYSLCQSGLATGRISQADSDWLAERGPGTTWMQKVRTPALVVHGTVDTLFTPAEAIENFRILRANGVPTRMLWFCGGHGTCNAGSGEPNYWSKAVLRWLARYLKGDASAGTEAAFEWIDQNGTWHAATDYPLADDGSITASGSGILQLLPGEATSGTATGATPAPGGVAVGVPAPGRNAYMVGAPRIEIEYSGQATPASAHAFAQLVDLDRNIVVGGQVTPLPLTLDGQTRTLNTELEPVAWAVGPKSRLELQIISSTAVYGAQRASGTVDLGRVALTLPLGLSPSPPPTPPGPTPGTPCGPTFSPRRARRRADGRVRFRPLVRCGGKRLRKRVTISDGRRRWRKRTGRVAVIRPRPAARGLRVRFRHQGRRHRATIRLRR